MSTPNRETAYAAAQQPNKNGFLYMHAVFRLVENDGVWRVHDRVGHLGTAVRGQTVHE
jgi:hypothetical protein